MTIEGKREAIKAYCDTHSCGSDRDCRLYEFLKGRDYGCWMGITDEQLEANYAYLFGGEVSSSVDHPSHYAGEKYECIEVMREVFGVEATKHFCLLNAFKYVWRCGRKHESPDEDINKAIWYLKKYLTTKEENT